MVLIKTKSARETQKIAAILAKETRMKAGKLWRLNLHNLQGALVIALEGDLGSGKTTFVQGFAKALGVKDKVLSPTFLILKIYQIRKIPKLKHLVHVDCYRIDSPKDLLHLGFRDLLKDKDVTIVIEWADRIKKLLPRAALWVRFEYGARPHERVIKILSTKP